MNDLILTAERRELIAELFNEILCSDIMCASFTKEADAARAKKDYAEAMRCHERWTAWWNMAHVAAEKLRGMGIPVTTHARPAK